MARFSSAEMALKNSGIDLEKACESESLPPRAEDMLLDRLSGRSLQEISKKFISSQITVRGVINLAIAKLLESPS